MPKPKKKRSDDLDMLKIPHLFVYNKMDQVETADFVSPSSPYVAISARSPQGIKKLEEGIITQIQSIYDYFEIDLPSQEASQFLGQADSLYIESFIFDEEKNTYLVKGYKRPQSKISH